MAAKRLAKLSARPGLAVKHYGWIDRYMRFRLATQFCLAGVDSQPTLCVMMTKAIKTAVWTRAARFVAVNSRRLLHRSGSCDGSERLLASVKKRSVGVEAADRQRQAAWA